MKRTIIASLLVLAGCGTLTPDCGSDDVLELVSEIAHEMLAETYRALGHEVSDAEVATKMALKPTLVRQTGYDAQNDTYSCDATLAGKMFDIEGKDDTEDYEEQITFTVSPAATGGGEFIVEVRREPSVDALLEVIENLAELMAP